MASLFNCDESEDEIDLKEADPPEDEAARNKSADRPEARPKPVIEEISELAQLRDLIIRDKNGIHDPSWLQCPCCGNGQVCKIQRYGYCLRPAHGLSGITMLKVQKYICRAHGDKVFNAASPRVFQQLQARCGDDQLEISPTIYVISGKTIVLKDLFEYVSLGTIMQQWLLVLQVLMLCLIVVTCFVIDTSLVHAAVLSIS